MSCPVGGRIVFCAEDGLLDQFKADPVANELNLVSGRSEIGFSIFQFLCLGQRCVEQVFDGDARPDPV